MARKVKTPERTPEVRAMLEDLAYMGRTGCTIELAAERMGISQATLRQRIDRHKAYPLWNRLRENERERFGADLEWIKRWEIQSARKFNRASRRRAA